MNGPRTAWLLLATGPRRTALWLRGRASVIGRSSACDLVIDGPGVSARHALVRRDDGGPDVAHDLCTPRGIRVNGRRVDRAELADGDVIAIGDARLVYLLAGGDPPRMCYAGRIPSFRGVP